VRKVAPGIKTGGYPGWIQAPNWRDCDGCGKRMDHLLTIVAGVGLRNATVENVQDAIDTLRVKADGSPVKASSVNTYIASVKSLLGFAHRVGYTRFSAGPLIRLKKTGRVVAQRIMSELQSRRLIDVGKPGRDRALLETAYFGGLRITELTTLRWSQIIPRDSGDHRQRRQSQAGADPGGVAGAPARG
jgi:site-specific recombinase XerD